MQKPSYDANQAAVQITRDNYHWGPAIGQPSGVITFGFRATTSANNDGNMATFTPVSTLQMTAIENAMRSWSSVANIQFNEVNAGGYTDNATMLFSNYSSTTDEAYAYGRYPGATGDKNRAGDVWINTANLSTSNMPYGSEDYDTLVHEIGHAIGLEHPGPYNGSPGVDITYSTVVGNGDNVFLEDSRQYSILSYFAAFNTGAHHVDPLTKQVVVASTPLLYDIAAVQRLYGANMTTRTGDTVYGFHGNTGTAFDIASATRQVVYAIWDAGGIDRLDCSGYTQNQRIDLHAGSFSDVGALTLNVAIAQNADIENASGGSGNDSITGNDGDNTLNGLAGDDKMYGIGGQDSLYGEEGNDTLNGGFGFVDNLYGGAGNDTYIISDLDNITEFNDDGVDTVRSSVRYVLGANLENLTLLGGANINGFGNDLANVMVGNSGNNYLQGGYGGDSLYGGRGNDYYELSDVFAASKFAQPKFDLVSERSNAGIDTVSVSSETFQLFGYTLATNVENAIISGAYVFGLTGNQLGNTLTGNEAANNINGKAGDDIIDGKAGLDTLTGELGNDVYILDDMTFIDDQTGAEYDRVVETAAGGIDKVIVTPLGYVRYYLDLNVENVDLAATGSLEVIGNDLDNSMNGNTGNNQFSGEGGNDRLDGKAGIDALTGGLGDDTYILGDVWINGNSLEFDQVSEAEDQGTDSVVVTSGLGRLTYGLDANIENAQAVGSADFDLVGNALDNILIGNSSHNVITANEGNDVLNGSGGYDDLIGGVGDDYYVLADVSTINGALQFDTVTEQEGAGIDTVRVYSNIGRLTYVLDANVDNAVAVGLAKFNLVGNGIANRLVGNSADNVLTGNEGDDKLAGGQGADHLRGNDGDDSLAGGRGDDSLDGGGGKDTFVFESGDGHDDIASFSGDIIDLSGLKGVDSRAAFISHSDDVKGGVLLTVDADTLFIAGMAKDDFTIDDFAF